MAVGLLLGVASKQIGHGERASHQFDELPGPLSSRRPSIVARCVQTEDAGVRGVHVALNKVGLPSAGVAALRWQIRAVGRTCTNGDLNKAGGHSEGSPRHR